MNNIRMRRFSAIAIICLLALFILYALIPYYPALFGALILYTLFLPLFKRLTSRGINDKLAAAIVIILSIVIILVPISILSTLAIGEVSSIIRQTARTEVIIERFNAITGLELEISSLINSAIREITGFLKRQIPNIISSVSQITISLVIVYFVMYYLLLNSKKSVNAAISVLPFNRKNSTRLVSEFQAVTKSTIIGMGIIAIVQGLLVTAAFLLFKINGAVFWGFISAILSFLPVVGAPLVWVPAAVIELLLGNYLSGIGLLAFGAIVISNVDNVLRPIISKRMANLHPIITLLGVFIGIPVFGIIGLIVGPLLLSYFFLMIRMFKEEYVRPSRIP